MLLLMMMMMTMIMMSTLLLLLMLLLLFFCFLFCFVYSRYRQVGDLEAELRTTQAALTQSQVIAFVVSVVICFVFTITGVSSVVEIGRTFLPPAVLDTITGLSFIVHFNAIMNGVIDLRDLVFFGSLIGLFLYATMVVIDLKKGA
jgi:Ca2+/Na+ antiporter